MNQMNTKYILLLVFALVAAAQLYIPVSMISEQEDILKTGKVFKFKTAPIDPNDPFRGKYVTLNFDNTVFKIIGDHPYSQGEDVYAQIRENEEGFVEILKLHHDRPSENIDFVKAKIGYINIMNDTTIVPIDYPFNRYYMEESKAAKAEETYAVAQIDSSKTAYAIVKIKNGDAVLEDVMIDGISINELVESESVE